MPTDNNAVLYTEKNLLTVNLMLSVNTILKKEKEQETAFSVIF